MREHNYECPQTGHVYSIKVGENGQDNWELIRGAGQNDLWFHVENNPSTHVILEVGKVKKIHKSVINFCAALTKEGSKLKNNKKVKIIYTEIRNVKINHKGNPGSVYTSKTRELKS